MRSIRRDVASRSTLQPLLWLFLVVILLLGGGAVAAYFYWQARRDPLVPQERHLVNTAPGYQVLDFEMTGEVTALSFSPDGKHLVAGTTRSGANAGKHWTGDLKVWDAATGDEKQSLTVSQWIHNVSFTPDGKFLAVACSSWSTGEPVGFMGFQQKKGEVRIYEFPAMKVWKILEFDVLVESARFSPNGESLAVAVDPHPKRMGPCELHLLAFPGLETSRVLKAPLYQPLFAFTSDSDKILFCGPRTGVERRYSSMLFNCKSGEMLDDLAPQGVSAHGQLSLEGDLLLCLGSGVRFFDSRNNQHRPDLRRQIATRNFDGKVLEWATMSPDQRYLLAVEAHHEHHRFVTSKVLLEDYQTGELTEVFKDPDCNVMFQRCALSPDATRIAVGTGQYVGIRGKHDDPRRGHVLLFEKKAAPK